jgi:hypothetical protein
MGFDIFIAAAQELNKKGESIETLAGLDTVYDDDGEFLGYERELTEQEILELSIQKLGDDGRFFEIFSDKQEFLKESDCFGLLGEAEDLLKKWWIL